MIKRVRSNIPLLGIIIVLILVGVIIFMKRSPQTNQTYTSNQRITYGGKSCINEIVVPAPGYERKDVIEVRCNMDAAPIGTALSSDFQGGKFTCTQGNSLPSGRFAIDCKFFESEPSEQVMQTVGKYLCGCGALE